MNTLFLKLTLLLAMLSLGLPAADATGTWKGSVTGQDGTTSEITLDLEVTAGGVSGTVYTNIGEMHITEGKVEGDKIHFVAEFADSHVNYEGTFTGNQMKLEVTMMSQKTTLVLKRTGSSGASLPARPASAGR